jgi:raffinose/stachyose/melibiose transport system permease protein
VLVAVLVVSVAVVLSILAGYAFGTMRFRGSTVLFYLFLLGMMVPAEAIVIPLFFDLRTAGLTDTIWAIALPQIAQSVAFGTFWMRSQFRAMPPNLIEAAAIDGTGGMGTLWRIMVPPSLPSIATVMVLMFMWTWNEFLIPLVMSPGGQWRTAPLGLAIFKGQYTADHALLAAAGVIIAAPIIVVFLALQRYFINGMLEGAAKE